MTGSSYTTSLHCILPHVQSISELNPHCLNIRHCPAGVAIDVLTPFGFPGTAPTGEAQAKARTTWLLPCLKVLKACLRLDPVATDKIDNDVDVCVIAIDAIALIKIAFQVLPKGIVSTAMSVTFRSTNRKRLKRRDERETFPSTTGVEPKSDNKNIDSLDITPIGLRQGLLVVEQLPSLINPIMS